MQLHGSRQNHLPRGYSECAIESLARIECSLASDRDGRYSHIALASEPGSP